MNSENIWLRIYCKENIYMTSFTEYCNAKLNWINRSYTWFTCYINVVWYWDVPYLVYAILPLLNFGVAYQCCITLLVFQEKLDLQDKLADTQADYNTLHSEHEELKQKFEKERQCTGTVGVLFCSWLICY